MRNTDPTTRRRRWRPILVAAGVVVVAALPGLFSAPASAQTTASPTYDQVLLSECPNLIEAYPASNPAPPLHSHPATAGFYGLPTAIRLTDGSLTLGSVAKASNVSATLCGYFVLPTLDARVTPSSVTTRGAPDECPGCSITFAPGSVVIAGLVTLPTTLSAAGPAVSTVSPQVGPNGGLELTVTTPVIATIKVPPLTGPGATGVSCTVGDAAAPIEVSVTTAMSGSLTGSALSGPLTGASASVVGERFPVPAIAPATDCPASIVPATNGLAGLPLAPGQSIFTGHLGTINSLTVPTPGD
jgi:hypothetical protein